MPRWIALAGLLVIVAPPPVLWAQTSGGPSRGLPRLPAAAPPASEMMAMPPLPPGAADGGVPAVGGQSLTLQAALYGALTGNPDLVTLRQGSPIANAPSPEALEVARRFPTTLNPTLWIDYRPLTYIPNGPGRGPDTDPYRSGNQFLYVSWRQPLELGHQTTHRYALARAALDQQRWTILQSELTTLVQTYRLFQAAAYRREKLQVASDLANFNDRLLQSLERRFEANQVPAADVVLARVEARASDQQVKAARQDYLNALADLNIQIGRALDAGTAEPLGAFTLPETIPTVDEKAMIRTALANRPDIHAAQALIRGTQAATRLARADRIPSPVVGPDYQINEGGTQFVGMVLITPVPVLNDGTPLVRQREAETRRACIALQQAQQRAIAQVRAAVVKWNGATDLINETRGLTSELAREVAKLELLFDESQSDLSILLQGRQRLIQLENSRLDALWAASQAQADLLLALGTPTLIQAMLNRGAEPAAAPASSPPPTAGASRPVPVPAPAVAPAIARTATRSRTNPAR
jgi:cobalt-zinc-cadmium efflux system outer membrane protein